MTRFTSRLELFALEGRDMPSVAAPPLAVLKKLDLPTLAPITLTAAPTPADQARGVVAAGKVMNQTLAAFPAQKPTPVSGPVSVAANPAARITPTPQPLLVGPGGVAVGPKANVQREMFGITAPAPAASPLPLKTGTLPTAGTKTTLTAGADAFKAWTIANGEMRPVSRTAQQSDGETGSAETATQPTGDGGAEKTTSQKAWDAAGSFLSDASDFASAIVDSGLVTTAGKMASTVGGIFSSLLSAVTVLGEANIDPVEGVNGVNAAFGYKECKERELATLGAKSLQVCLEERKKNALRPDPMSDGPIRGAAGQNPTPDSNPLRGLLVQPVPGETMWQKLDPTLGRALMADSMAAGQGTKINPARGDGNVDVRGPAPVRDGVDCPPEQAGNGVGTPGRPSA